MENELAKIKKKYWLTAYMVGKLTDQPLTTIKTYSTPSFSKSVTTSLLAGRLEILIYGIREDIRQFIYENKKRIAINNRTALRLQCEYIANSELLDWFTPERQRQIRIIGGKDE